MRLTFQHADPEACARCQQATLERTWEPALRPPWILDMVMTVKPIYGYQQEAETEHVFKWAGQY